MGKRAAALVLGVGEIGGPLADVLSRGLEVARLDIGLDPEIDEADFLHVCYPFQIDDFVGTTAAYVDRYRPSSVIVHSTVVPGTTAQIQERVPDTTAFYSPVRGKHAKMGDDLLRYRKFLAGPDDAYEAAAAHLSAGGLEVERMAPVEGLEVAKLLETTYFGVLIAWAQEAERFAKAVGADYASVIRFVEEVPFLPDNYWPGFIGGHCVMPNIELLRTLRDSAILDAVKDSNERFAQG
jgi:UDP-N-acetyl-D-mannosaminuronate dehydrogenase